MVYPINAIRNNITYNYNVGITDDGNSKLYIESIEPNGLERRAYFKKLEIEATGEEGEVTSIKTTWKLYNKAPDGTKITIAGVSEETVLMITNKEDIAEFIKTFGMAILFAMSNGYMRDNLGFNHLPLIDTRATINGSSNPNYGQPRVWSAYLESTPPTNDYNSWKVGDPLPEVLTEPS